MSSAKYLNPALAAAEAHGRRDTIGMAIERDCHRQWPGRGGGSTAQKRCFLSPSVIPLSFLRIVKYGSGELGRGGRHMQSYQSNHVLDLMQRDMQPTWVWFTDPFLVQIKGYEESQKEGMVIFLPGSNVMNILFLSASWYTDAGLFTYYYRYGASIEQIWAHIQTEGISFSFYLLHARNIIDADPFTSGKYGETYGRMGCMRSVKSPLADSQGEKW